jgi:hypothetical protein
VSFSIFDLYLISKEGYLDITYGYHNMNKVETQNTLAMQKTRYTLLLIKDIYEKDKAIHTFAIDIDFSSFG